MKQNTQIMDRVQTRYRKLILMLADIFIFSFSYLAAWIILVRRISLADFSLTILAGGACFIVIFFFIYMFFGMYDSLWRYAEAHEFIKCLLATLLSSGIFTAITLLWLRPPLFPQRIPITVYFLSLTMAGGSSLFLRMAYRAYRTTRIVVKTASGTKKVIIVGAGETGNAVLQNLYREPKHSYEIVCFVDDNPEKKGRILQRVKVEGATKDIPRIVEKYGIEIIILAIPSASNNAKRRITNICAKTKCQLKKVPDLYAFVTNAQSIVSQIQDVSVEDLLGRDVVDIGARKSNFLMDKVVMVTGAGGSIGSELCRQVIKQRPKALIMVDISENGLYAIQQELLRGRASYERVSLHAEVASVRDKAKIELLFGRYRPEVVYHAAAHKHVPLMESAPEEAVKNNIFGTLNIARCADRYGAKRFVMISTDKAVNPTSIMGASKRVCEMIIQAMSRVSKTGFVAVRFGNVLGSNGSVIPLFKEQIAAGGPVTVTHPDIIRYFMTISEAVSLVMTAGEMAMGNEIFILDMGEPVKILDLAESLIRLSGYEPYKDINIEFSGMRPGEKLYEELMTGEEGLKKTSNDKIFVGNPIDVEPEDLFFSLRALQSMVDGNDTIGIVEKLRELVPGFGDSEAISK